MKIIVCCLLTFFIQLTAEVPDWVQSQGKSAKYPQSQYLTGFGLASVNAKNGEIDALNQAVGSARKNLIEKIRIKIESVSSSKSEEIGDRFSSLFTSATQSSSNLEIHGLTTESYFDESEDIFYVYVFVNRENLISFYKSKIQSLRKELAEKVQIAKQLEQQSRPTNALNEYFSCYPIIRELEESQSVFTSIKATISMNEFEQFSNANEISAGQIRDAITKLVQRPISSVDDISWFLVYQLKEQIGQKIPNRLSLLVSPLVYQDTKMGSSFSRYFNQLLEQKLNEVAQWEVIQQSSPPYILTGSYWIQNNKIKFIVNIRDTKEGKIIGSAETNVPEDVINVTNRPLTPENYKDALIDKKIFSEGEVAGGGLTVEAWTNKENQGNLFIKGEKMNISVRVNMPCYIRLVYHMADGKRNLLYNEYFMDASKVNVAYEIPQEFECAAPFGSEVLQIFARNDKFESVQTIKENGYEYLQDDLKTFVSKTRGMKASKGKVLQAEERITITTMEQ